LGGFGGRPLGRRAQAVRSCVDLAAWLADVWVLDGLHEASCWLRTRRWHPRCCGTGGAGGWAGGWVGGWAGGNAVCSKYVVVVVVVVVVADVCGCRQAGM
jgi:hypothetical protein